MYFLIPNRSLIQRFCIRIRLRLTTSFLACSIGRRNHPFLPRFELLTGLKGQRVKQFACGGEHSAALVANGDVYCWGAG